MTYDLHGSWDTVTGPHTALQATDGLSIDHAVDLYLESGVPPNKLMLGLAAYGRTWTLVNPSNHVLGSPASGAGTMGACTQESGFLNSLEISDMITNGGQMVIDTASQTAFAWRSNQFVTFDTIETHRAKTDFLCSKVCPLVSFPLEFRTHLITLPPGSGTRWCIRLGNGSRRWIQDDQLDPWQHRQMLCGHSTREQQ